MLVTSIDIPLADVLATNVNQIAGITFECIVDRVVERDDLDYDKRFRLGLHQLMDPSTATNRQTESPVVAVSAFFNETAKLSCHVWPKTRTYDATVDARVLMGGTHAVSVDQGALIEAIEEADYDQYTEYVRSGTDPITASQRVARFLHDHQPALVLSNETHYDFALLADMVLCAHETKHRAPHAITHVSISDFSRAVVDLLRDQYPRIVARVVDLEPNSEHWELYQAMQIIDPGAFPLKDGLVDVDCMSVFFSKVVDFVRRFVLVPIDAVVVAHVLT